jgi:hypothetical protein
MIKGLVEIISRKSAHRNMLRQVTLTGPLQRFNNNQYFSGSKLYDRIAKALAKHTNLIVDALLSDASIPDWRKAGDRVTVQQVSDLSIFCSHCLFQFSVKDLQNQLDESASARLEDRGLRADISDLIRLMYGDFVTGAHTGGFTFDESLASRDLEDPEDIRYLTRLLDQLMGLTEVPEGTLREREIQELRRLFRAHGRAFAYTLHTVL